jgi:branched-chain amino acid transport system substrate-binding protein
VAKWRKEFKKRVGEKQGRPTITDMWNYSAAEVYLEGLKRAGKNLTREKFVEALESIKNFETSFLVDKINFSKNKHQGNSIYNFIVVLPNMKRAILNYTVKGE